VVVFEVSGYIEIDSPLVIKHPYVTVAGHTAPWPGIVIRGGYPLSVATDDVLIQHICFRNSECPRKERDAAETGTRTLRRTVRLTLRLESRLQPAAAGRPQCSAAA
jgi:hypothetical protein